MAKKETESSQKAQGGASKQSADAGAKQSAGSASKSSSGKDAASHTKAGETKGAGGGKKQARKH